MGYKNPYEEREKLFENKTEERNVNQRDARKRLDGLFAEPQKPVKNRCSDGHKWRTFSDGKARCAYCKISKPQDK